MALLLALLLAFLLLGAAAEEEDAQEERTGRGWGEGEKPGGSGEASGVPRILSMASVLSSAASEASDACSLRASVASEAVFQPRMGGEHGDGEWPPGGSTSSLPRLGVLDHGS